MTISIDGRRMQRSDPSNGAAADLPASAGASAVGAGSPSAPGGRFALRELQMPPLRRLAADTAVLLAVLLAIGLALGWMAPFGTDAALGVGQRFVYWGLAVPLVGLPATLIFRAVFLSAALLHWAWPGKLVGAALVAAIPGTLIVRALGAWFAMHDGDTPLTVAASYGAVALLTVAIGLWTMVLTQREVLWPPPAPPPPALAVADAVAPPRRTGGSPFLDRIPPKLGTNLVRIETEDHYLRVHTDLGSDLVLFRLADALAEIDAALGLQVHRSHWVARRAVARVERDGHRTTLLLSDGARVPVSRTFLPALRRAGWL